MVIGDTYGESLNKKGMHILLSHTTVSGYGHATFSVAVSNSKFKQNVQPAEPVIQSVSDGIK